MVTSTATHPAPEATDSGPQRGRSRWPRPRGMALYAYLLLLPAVIMLGIFTVYTLAKMFLFSFQDYTRKNVFNPQAPADFVGRAKYRAIRSNERFMSVLGRSVALCAGLVDLTTRLGMLIELLMNRLRTSLGVLVRIGLVLAWAMAQLTSTVVWGWMFVSQYGVV